MEHYYYIAIVAQQLSKLDTSMLSFYDIISQQSSLDGAEHGKIHVSQSLWENFIRTGNFISQNRLFLSDSGNHAAMKMDMSHTSWNDVSPDFHQFIQDARRAGFALKLAKSYHGTCNTILNGHLTEWHVKLAFIKARSFHVELDTPPS